jgi:hypothetical protein
LIIDLNHYWIKANNIKLSILVKFIPGRYNNKYN